MFWRKKKLIVPVLPAAPAVVPNGKTIVIVDDDPVIVKALSTKLEANGFRVLSASDCREGLGMCREVQPDLVLLDINFPPDGANGGGWDGFTLMRWLRSVGWKVPVFMMSVSDDPRLKDAALKLGAAGFFQKPIDYLTIIGEAFSQSTGHDEESAGPPHITSA